MPFNFTVLSPRHNGNLRLMCQFDKLPEGNVVVPNNLYFKDYVRNNEVEEKWAASTVIKCHRRACAEEKENARLLFQYLLSKDYSARASIPNGSVFLRTLPIDELSGSENMRLLCCFRQPLKRASSCDSVESSNQSSSGDDRELSPANYTTIPKPSSSHHTTTGRSRVKEVSVTASMIDCTATRSPRCTENDDLVVQESKSRSKMYAFQKKISTKACCVKCGKWHEHRCKDNPCVPPRLTCSFNPNPWLSIRESKRKGFSDFEPQIGESRKLKEVRSQLPTKISADRSERSNQTTADPRVNRCRNFGAKEDRNKKVTEQVHPNPTDERRLDTILADWRAKLNHMIVSGSTIKRQLPLSLDLNSDSRLYHHGDSQLRVDWLDVQSPDNHDKQKRRIRHSHRVSARVQYEAPALDKNKLAPRGSLKRRSTRKRSSSTKKRYAEAKRNKRDSNSIDNFPKRWPDSTSYSGVHEEMVTTVHIIDEISTSTTHTNSQAIFDLDQVMDIDHLF